MKKIEESLFAFEEYKNVYGEYLSLDLTESDTRSKLIDKILIDILGWDEKDIKREGKVDSGYFDYKISVPGISFLVEAKKQFKEVILPTNHKTTSLNVLLKQNKEVIQQIRSYGIDEGIQYGVVTNGTQIIILKIFNTDGKPWKENIAFLFNGLKDIENRFIEFYENLSKYSVVNNGGFKFELPINVFQGKRIVASLVDKDKELIRNSLSAILTPLVDRAFGEMFSEEREDDLEFIKSCFVENLETKKNKNEIERLFSDDAPELKNVIPIVNSNNLVNSIVQEITHEEITIKNAYPPNPIIIIGSKGAGKTTFINHLFKYKITQEEIINHFVIYIDFRKFFETYSSFDHAKISSEILEAIYDKYPELELHTLKKLIRIYLKEIKRNDESIWEYDKVHNEGAYQNKLAVFLEESKKDTFKHLILLSHYMIRERRKRLIVIIDNADQFSEDIQGQLFVFSHSLTKSSFCGTVISLREGYFRRWQNSPPFDAYESNVYHITAPHYSEIIEKRIDFAIKKNSMRNEKFEIPIAVGKTISLTSEYIDDFLKGLKNSLLSEENSELLEFINLTTFPNIREGLKVIKIFLNSGHTKIKDYINREAQRMFKQSKHSVIPLHEFIKSIALQNRHYYSSEVSIVYNILNPPNESNDHFLKIYILHDLAEILENTSYSEKFVSNQHIIDKLHSFSYKINVINSALSSLIAAYLVDTDQLLSDVEWTNLPSTYNVNLTAKGYYYLKCLGNRFLYYDLVAQDTPIYDDNFYEELKNIFPLSTKEGSRNIELRKEYTKLFISYLEFMENKKSPQIRAIYGAVFQNIKASVFKEID